MQDFKELLVWQRAHRLVLRVYQVSKEMPQSENFGLILNLRRCAVGVATRIAEGAGRSAKAEFAGELKRARATAFELEYLLLLSRDLGFLEVDVYDEVAGEVEAVGKMISGLLKRVTDGS
jgi:four helix bundle protein